MLLVLDRSVDEDPERVRDDGRGGEPAVHNVHAGEVDGWVQQVAGFVGRPLPLVLWHLWAELFAGARSVAHRPVSEHFAEEPRKDAGPARAMAVAGTHAGCKAGHG